MTVNSSSANDLCSGPDPHWGARQQADGRWSVGLWAPSAGLVQVENVTRGLVEPCSQCQDGWHVAVIEGDEGDAYRLHVDGLPIPDPASRQQQDDVHGPSLFARTDVADWPDTEGDWRGRAWEEAVIYEIHVGSFTRQGTFAAAAERLADLATLGITCVELMPIAAFSGKHGWGYDGVLPYAPHPAYGSPSQLRAFVARAHALGLSVILDVVYNHFGPDGSYLHQVAPEFFDADRHTPWGQGIDYAKRPVRDFFLQSARMWRQDYHIDGFRIDAAHQIRDSSRPEFLVELARILRTGAGEKPLHLILEDERNLTALREPAEGLYDAEWNDDYHHAVHCLLTGEDEDYYASFAVDPMADLVRAMAEGQVEQGQPREGLDGLRGAPSAHLPTTAFVNANQNHDQIGNRAKGERLLALAEPKAVEVAHCLLLATPFIPMLFMGEETGSRAPFLFFADYSGELARLTREGRQKEFAAFEGFEGAVPDPMDIKTFTRCYPFDALPDDAAHWTDLTAKLLALRAEHIVPLLKSGRDKPPVARQTGPRSLAAEWSFAAGTVGVQASFGAPAEQVLPVSEPVFRLAPPDAPFNFTLSLG